MTTYTLLDSGMIDQPYDAPQSMTISAPDWVFHLLLAFKKMPAFQEKRIAAGLKTILKEQATGPGLDKLLARLGHYAGL